MQMSLKSYFLLPRFHFNRIQFNLLTLCLITIGLVSGSYFTLNKIFKSLATNDTTKQWLFNSSTAADYSTNKVLVDDFGARPAESANLFTNSSFSTDTTGWTNTAIAPSGWVVVPGNSTFGTGDFLAMKYEAKALDTQTSMVVYDGGTTSGAGWAGTNSQTRFQAVSVAEGRPWVYIAQSHATNFDAVEACQAVAVGSTTAHLINNNEWMTMARNAEGVATNWTSGIGSTLVRGNSNGSLSLNGSSTLSGINRRTYYLTNGEIIWDLAGNVYDWNSDVQTTAIDTTGAWVEWNHANIAAGARELYGPSSAGYLSANGMGQVYGGSLNNGFLRGGVWINGSYAGVFALSLYYSPGLQYNNIGFRCASDTVAISQSFSSSGGRVGGGDVITNSSFVDSKMVQSVNVGSSAAYDLSVMVYNNSSGSEGSAVDGSVAIVYANGTTYPSTQYEAVGSGWYKVSATVIGTSAPAQYGLAVKAGKAVKVDDFYLTKSVNRFDNPSFTNNINGWSVGAVSGSSTPEGYVVVPGNSTFNTGDFLMMKYEAKAYDTQTSAVVTDGGYSSGAGWAGTNSQIRYRAVSVSTGQPWVYIGQSEGTNFDATEACQAITIGSTNAHLITENQWLTVANNVASRESNWTNGIGSTLPRGNSDSGASLDGSNALSGVNLRTLTMSNGEITWDLGANVREWTSGTIQRKDQPYSWNGSVGSTAWGYSDFEAGSSSVYMMNYKIGSSLQQKTAEPLDFSYTHNANYGLGRIYHYSDLADSSTTTYGFLRGGIWNAGSNAGVFALNLYNSPGIQNNNIGFRCASDTVAISQSFQSSTGRAGGGGQKVVASGIADAKIYQNVDLGDTATYIISAYVYDDTSGNVAGEVNDSIATLYADNQAVTAEYSDVGLGWWKLTGTVTGSTAIKEYGVLVKSGKTVYVDDFSLAKSGFSSVYTKTAYSNAQVSSWDSFSVGVTQTDNSVVRYQICTSDGDTCEANIGSSSPTWQYWNGSTWSDSDTTITTANAASDLTEEVMQSIPVTSKEISVKVLMTYEGDALPVLNSVTVGMTTDVTAPTNATDLVMHQEISATNCTDEDNCWTKLAGPTFSWAPGADEEGGSGLKGYCLYLGTEANGNPAQNKGKLGTSPVSTANTPCQFIVSSSSIDLSTAGYLSSALSNSDSFDEETPNTYYLNIKAVDVAGNTSSALSIRFRYDGVAPTNVAYISPASGSFSNVADMSFSWPTSGSSASSDSESGVLGWQYQINSTAGTWLGSTTSPDLGIEYIPAGNYTYQLTSRDSTSISTGNNVVYFRTVDKTGNVSSSGTIRTGNLSFGGDAPSFDSGDEITITPETSDTNSFSLSWPEATATNGQQVSKYYYMVNVSPPSTLATLQGNASTYIDVGTSKVVMATALANVNKGTNTVYVVAIDDEETANYSPSNYISGTFTLNSNTPDNVGDLVASDSSIKAKSQWNVTLTWTAPSYQGAGNLTYQIYRSSDGTNFSLVGTSSGLSYVDSTPESSLYYYKVYTKDGANAVSSGTNAVSLTPTGKYTSAAGLSSGPEVGSISTRKATITWSTDRNSDSKIQYGTSSGSYNTVEPSNSSQVTSHSIILTGLEPGTTYYYRAKWTDEDGNTGTSDEKSFSTQATPSVKDVSAGSINLSSTTIQFTSNRASKVKIYYGATTSFGGLKTLETSTSETVYTVNLADLSDGTKYYYKINTVDSDGYEYEGTVLDFATLPRPRISNVQLQEVTGTAQTTLKITWNSNTAISSIVSYYPSGTSSVAKDQVKVDLLSGKHEMTISGLQPQTNYDVVIKGTDKIGNQAISEVYQFTTASDSRPPEISAVKVEGSTVPAVTTTGQESVAQLVVTWDTDEPASSQVEFGEGTGMTYSQKTQEDTNLTTNHLVLISNLTPSKVYHLRTISKDQAGNVANSVDTVTITPKATDNALDLVITNLGQIFSFLGGVFQK